MTFVEEVDQRLHESSKRGDWRLCVVGSHELTVDVGSDLHVTLVRESDSLAHGPSRPQVHKPRHTPTSTFTQSRSPCVCVATTSRGRLPLITRSEPTIPYTEPRSAPRQPQTPWTTSTARRTATTQATGGTGYVRADCTLLYFLLYDPLRIFYHESLGSRQDYARSDQQAWDFGMVGLDLRGPDAALTRHSEVCF